MSQVESNFQLLERLYESPGSLVQRARERSSGRPVVLKQLKAAALTAERLQRYQREFELLSALDLAGVVKTYDFLRLADGYCLVSEDFGGESLTSLLAAGPLPLAEFFPLAMAACAALSELHLAGVIHKDISPANLVCNRQTGQLKIIDFGIASRLPRLSAPLKNPEFLEGTLAYIAPEQTGRLNRSLDYRADLYALGASFYEMLAGRPPFIADSPGELVYCHLARQPQALDEMLVDLPPVLARIIGKLLAKNPEDRYQSAWGVRADLAQCDRLWRAGEMAGFVLGQQDIPLGFHVSQRLYGREKMIARLQRAFAAVGERRQMVVVGGYSGIGKTSLVREIHAPLTRAGGRFISGKFDQLQKNTPYSAVVAAFRELIQHYLSASETELADCRQRILAAVGGSGQVISRVLPEIELIIGPQAEVPDLPPTEAQNRFNQLFQRFVAVFCRPESPLVLFLDDLQWADLASLRLIETLMGDAELRHFLLLGAFRDNEVEATHPFAILLARLRASAFAPELITLTPLSGHDVTCLLADTLRCPPEEVSPLATLVFRKTLGNPFFVIQFLKVLYRDGLLAFSPERRRIDAGISGWHWDMARIVALGMTDNVVDLMLDRLRELPEETRAMLCLAASVGASFSLATLAIIDQKPEPVVAAALLPALQAELIEAGETAHDAGCGQASFRFLHDRVQQAAYALIPVDERPAMHIRVGRLLLARLGEAELRERMFEVADHLNAGQSLIDDPAERLQLAGFNLKVARRAKRANAYAAALGYLDVALACLPPDAWDSDYELSLGLYRLRAEVCYLNGDFDASMADIACLRTHARSALEKAEICALLITEYTMLGRNEEAVATAGEALALLGTALPADPRAALPAEMAPIREVLQQRSIASLIEQPAMQDPVQQVAMKVLMPVHTAAYFAGQRDLYAWFLARMTRLSLQYGHVPESSKGYASFGGVLCGEFGEYRQGYEFARLAIELAARYHDMGLKCRASLIMVAFVNHWSRPLAEGDAYEDQGIQAGMEAGEFQFVSYLLMWGKVINRFHRALPMVGQLEAAASALAFTRKVQNHLTTDSILGVRAVLGNLAGQTGSAHDFDFPGLSEADYLQSCREHNSYSSLACYHTLKALALYVHGCLPEARANIERAAADARYISSYFTDAELKFLHALILLSSEAALDDAEKAVLAASRAQLVRWAEACPENFRHKLHLLAAEEARREGRIAEAFTAYDAAIAGAAAAGFVSDEALANERAAAFWRTQGKDDFAALYLRRAWQAYQLWGAERKLAELENACGALLASEGLPALAARSAPTALGVRGERLDFNALVEAGQVLAGEIRIKELKRELMRIAMTSAGADSGFLLLDEGGRLVIEARASSADASFSELPSIPLDDAGERPEEIPIARAIVHYVLRSGAPVVLADAASDERFARDPCILARRPRSLFCLPLIQQGQLSGVLYLENHLVSGAFNPARLRLLELLSAQMATAIENARIHSRLDELVQRRTAELEAVNHSLQREIDERIVIESELKQAQVKAEAATVAKSEFLARMSHEIRTPMNAVIGLSQLLLRTELNAKQRDYVRKLVASAQSLLGIINDILDFSKIEAGKMTIERIPFVLRDMVDGVADLFTARAEEKGLDILFRLDEALPERLLGDPLRLGQVLSNLVGNAVKFTASGEVVLNVALLAGTGERLRLRFSVDDTGIGMSAAEVEQLFQPFQQADGSITRRFGGTGLGLTIASQLVGLMGGRLQVDSTPAQGSSFAFELEFGRVDSPPQRQVRSSASLAGMRALVVDDNATSRQVLSALLLNKGLRVETAESGEAALQALEIQRDSGAPPYDLILMDWKMPGLDGIETTRLIKLELPPEMLPAILMVSAFGREETMQEADRAGVDGFLVKPVSESLLHDTLQNLFGLPAMNAPGGNSRPHSLAAIRGARVLVVEDNVINQQVACELLEQLGMQVELAGNGVEGVKQALAGAYDLVLMDIQMPEMDGLEATRQIRAEPAGAELPIIAMTAHAQQSDRERSLDAGMNDHLTKPIDLDRLSAVLLRWIAPRHPVTAELPAATVAPGDEISPLPRMPGYDGAFGLSRVGGSISLYRKLLREFNREYANSDAGIQALLFAGRREEAMRLAHSVKGAAAALGALGLADAAGEMEKGLRTQASSGEIERARAAYRGQLQAFCQAIAQHLPAADEGGAVVGLALAARELQARLGELLLLLESGNAESETLIGQLRSRIAGEWGREQLGQIAGYVEDVEFPSAAGLVREWMARLGEEVGA